MKNVIFNFKRRLLFILMSVITFGAFSQTISVSGSVKDTSGEPMIGVTVQVLGTSVGTVTDFDGNFVIPNVPSNGELVISYVGMVSQTISVNGRTSINVVLADDTETLEELVVIGYGVQKKSDVTGASLRVSGEELKSRPITNALQGLQGKVAGVDITSNERPGQLSNITIRGVRSLTASNDPLYVVDGVPLMTGSIDNINPNDIEAIDVLKDASATAIYGSRGANGVIIITTKQGVEGRFTLSYSGSMTAETLQNSSKLTNASEYIDYRRWAYYYSNPEIYPRGDQPTVDNDYKIFLGAGDPYAWANIMKGWNNGTWNGSLVETTDWVDMVTRTGITQEHTLNTSGGTKQMKGYLSFGYLNNQGTSFGQSYERYTVKSSIDVTPVKWFSFGGTINASFGIQEYGQSSTGGNTNRQPGSIYSSARNGFPYAVPFDDNGNRITYPGGDDAVRTVVDEWKYSQDQRKTFRAFASLYSQIDFGSLSKVLEGLKYRLNFGPDLSVYRNGVYVDSKSIIRTGSSFASLDKAQTLSYTLDNLIMYDKTIDKHNLGVTLLHSITDYGFESSYMDANNIPFPSHKWNALTTSNVPILNKWESDLIEKQLMSYMMRVNYGLSEKYLLTLSGRWDGASQLAEGHKWAFFPSAAVGWRIEQEDFLSNYNWISQLKLRFGYGVTGNSAISPYATKGGLTSLFYPYYSMPQPGSLPATLLANQQLGWEKTGQYNLGLDFSFFNNRVSGVVDVYKSRTTDLLLDMTIPSVTGYTSTYANIGETSNKGVDLTLNTVNVSTRKFEWTSSLNLSWQKDKIVSLATNDDDINNNWFIGEQIGVIYGYKFDKIWQKEDADEMNQFNQNGNNFKPGQVKPLDLNGDKYIDANNDRMIVGNTRPNWVVGWTNNIKLGDFDLSVFMYGRLKYMYKTGGESLVGRFNVRKVDYYTEVNPFSEYQRPEFTTGTGDAYYEIIGYKKASFIKVRNISLGYRLPKNILSNLNLSGARIYAQVVNPGTIFSQIKFLDMDTQSDQWNRGFTLGVNIDF